MADLFEELHIGSLAARNRMVRAATAESIATPAGAPTPELREMYLRLADGGVGTIITGYSFVSPDGKASDCSLSMVDDSFGDEYRDLVDAVHERGAAIVAQLVYGGSKSKLSPDDPRRLASRDADLGGMSPNVDILGASVCQNPKTKLVSREASADELARLARDFASAAARAQSYGFDGVEIHAAHGYLLSQFLSPCQNKRTDQYGGSLRNRARLALECVSAVRDAVGEGYPVFVKVNACDAFGDPQGCAGGLSEDESAFVCEWLAEAGASCLDVSGDWHAASAIDTDEPYFSQFGRRLSGILDVPVIVTGGWRDYETVRLHLRDDGIAGVGLCRPLICEPDLARRWASGDVRSSACIGCMACAKSPGIPCAVAKSR